MGDTSARRRWTSSDFPHANLAPDVVIEATDVEIGEGAQIDAGVTISAASVKIGCGTRLERGTAIRGLGSVMERFAIGDESLLGFESQILTTSFEMGDYCQLHNSGLHTGYKPLSIGHNCWIGQNSILNCTEKLTVGNNCRIGTQSQLWTHVASGELLEGCTLFGETPLVLEDNVWIVGGAVISPGLVLGRNSIVMTGSVLTRSTEPFHTYAGVPAKDVTEKLSFWKPVSDQDKLTMMQGWVDEFAAAVPTPGRVHAVEEAGSVRDASSGDVVVALNISDWEAGRSSGVSLFDLSTKSYLKLRSPTEVAWIRWLVGYRARFLPLDGTPAARPTASRSAGG